MFCLGVVRRTRDAARGSEMRKVFIVRKEIIGSEEGGHCELKEGAIEPFKV
jgi:hypothetical protein